jgi:dTDP-4-amino-4,6-dideoxygalactose transaminase
LLTQIRPVGNKVKLKAQPFDSNLFAPYEFYGYQSGTAALAAALICARNKHSKIESPEVLLPAYACPDLISACLFAKVKPILIDLEANRPWMDLVQIRQKITSSSIAIIAVNFLGIPERVSEIKEITKSNSIVIIEDSAQGVAKTELDNYWKGDLIITSFGRGKPISLFGGGAVLYKNKEFSQHLPKVTPISLSLLKKLIYQFKVSLVNILSSPLPYYFLTKLPFLSLGETHFKPLEKLEALSRQQQNYLTHAKQSYDSTTQLNHEISAMVRSLNCDLIIDLPKICKLDLNQPLLRYPLLITDINLKNRIAYNLEKEGLGISYMYQKPLINIDSIPSKVKLSTQIAAIAEKFSQQLITLPTHSDINTRIIDKIKRAVLEALNHHLARSE